MRLSKTVKSNHLLRVSVLFIAVGTLLVGAAAIRRDNRNSPSSQRQRARAVPSFFSLVPDMEIVSTHIEEHPQVDIADLIVTVRNKSQKGVTGYRVTSGDFGTGLDGGMDKEVPTVVIEPGGIDTVKIPLSNLSEDQPLVLSAAFFADGSEQGTEATKSLMRSQRKSFKEELKKWGRSNDGQSVITCSHLMASYRLIPLRNAGCSG